ncbi:MAG TPA: sigma-70 family RNA polymerase sigma factor [Atopostipes sp.]|nr:sigma-70 family RNA polymerase sigma factor [Atopostipes sp.]
MNEEHSIIQRVYDAKDDMTAADSFISDYIPFIKAQVSKLMKRPVNIQQDDEYSVAMIAFHEAINGYSKTRGTFLSYASLLMRNRIIDFWRKNNRHNQVISINAPTSNEDQTIEDSLTDDEDYEENLAIREATKEEIIELSTQLRAFDVSLTDIADNSPKQERTLAACKRVVAYVKEDAELMEDFLRTKRLPLKKLTDGSKVARKTIERHRKYIIGLLLIYTNGYEIIRGHLAEVMKGVTV